MADLYFRGSIVDYWKFMYGEYSRYFFAHKQEPFQIGSNRLTSPLFEHVPNINDFVLTTYFDVTGRQAVVSVEAVNHIDAKVVELKVLIYPVAFEEAGRPAHQRWLDYLKAMKKTGRLINLFVQFEFTKAQKQREETARKIKELREFRIRVRDRSGTIPKLTYALNFIKIAHRTVKIHDEELIKNWKDDNYD